MGFKYQKHSAWAESLSIVMQLGLTMAGCIFFGFFTGRALDKWLGSGGIITVFAVLFGIIGGGVVCYRQILDIVSENNHRDDNEHGQIP